MSTESINLAEECGPLPNGHDMAGYNGYHGNLTITVTGSLSFNSGIAWAVAIDKPTITARGRKGKPKHVMTLRANESEGVPDLLRDIAAMWEQGNMVIGQSYPIPQGAGS